MADIELINPVLGLNPFVLLEFHQGNEGPDDLRLRLQHGGGVDTTDEIGATLAAALAELPGVETADEYGVRTRDGDRWHADRFAAESAIRVMGQGQLIIRNALRLPAEEVQDGG